MKVKIRTGTRSNIWPKMAEKFWVTKTRPVLRHWCQASRIRGCETFLNLTGRIRFNTVGHL